MSEIENPKALFESTCSTNSESFALQNLGDRMEPEFGENCIIIVDPGMRIHHQAYTLSLITKASFTFANLLMLTISL